MPTGYPINIEIGTRFGKLIVVGRAASTKDGSRVWLCQCDCGAVATATSRRLTTGNKKSCGCLAKSLSSKRLKTHGLTYTPAWYSWQSMKARCLNPNAPKYHLYGGRGIRICERWMKFENFLADMGERPDGTTLDRIDCNGNYEPSNCRWADANTQSKNRRAWGRKATTAVSFGELVW